jgi:hypothetical protein
VARPTLTWQVEHRVSTPVELARPIDDAATER